MAILNQNTEPGVFSRFRPTTTFPVLPGGIRVAALIGKGRETNIVNGEVVTKGILNALDSLANTAVVLGNTIIDEDFNQYLKDRDYQLTTGEVDWSLTIPAELTGTLTEPFNLSGNDKVLNITVADANGGLEQSYTFIDGDFASPAAATAVEVKDAINANFTGVTATVSGGPVVLTTDTGDNTSLLIGDGDANALIGFTDGSFVETPREPEPGKTYQVDYEYAKSSGDYVPRFFFNMSDVNQEHGEVTDVNTISTGAEIVFQQGASAIALIQIDPADGAVVQQFRKAIDKLLSIDDINIVVPLSTDVTLYSYLETHVNLASSVTERKERTGIVGLSGSPTVQTVTTFAEALADKRMVLVYPPSATRFVGTNQTPSTLDGSFIAAAIAGIRTSREFDVADPLTRKEITGFQSIEDTLLRAEKNLLTSKGVLVVDTIATIPRVRHGVTTDPSTVENREYSVVEIIDFVAVSTRKLLEAIYIGQKILADTPSQIKSTIDGILADLVSREVVVSFKDISAAINGSDSTQIDVSFKISPVFPLNFIFITFSLSASA